jgi:hypothetical protein
MRVTGLRKPRQPIPGPSDRLISTVAIHWTVTFGLAFPSQDIPSCLQLPHVTRPGPGAGVCTRAATARNVQAVRPRASDLVRPLRPAK